MPERLDEKTKTALRSYLSDVRASPNEWATTHRFATLIGELFPGSPASKEFAAGVEKFIRIDTAAGEKRGRIDSYYGNAVIEFERSLKATGARAEQQLREYVSGVWAKEAKPPRPLIAIASDGICWRTYRPTLVSGNGGKPKAGASRWLRESRRTARSGFAPCPSRRWFPVSLGPAAQAV
jgi:hypothetical protein